MGQQNAFALGRSNLNRFLFADIGVESSGMSLSVISALARQGLDPWQEAGRLANLPRLAATDGLARLIAAMPSSLWPMPDATVIATRLVALLPRHDDSEVGSGTVLSYAPSPADEAQRGFPWLIVAVAVVAVLVGVAAYVAPARTGSPASTPTTSKSTTSVPTQD